MDIKRVKRQYDKSDNFQTRINFWEKYSKVDVPWHEWVFDRICKYNQSNILELGCGTGQLWSLNLDKINKNQKIVLSDFSEGMINITKKKLTGKGNFDFKIFPINSIPYNDEYFDGVIANHMMYIVENISDAIASVRRILKLDGVFFITTNSNKHRKELIELIEVVIENKFEDICERFNNINGKKYLKDKFEIINEEYFTQIIEVDDAEILLNYIFSISFIQDLDVNGKEKLVCYFKDYFIKNKIFKVTKEFVMFICR